ncbi:VanZ family protein [Haladaptatus sp. NG-WS-4]
MYRVPSRVRWVAVFLVASVICYFSVVTSPAGGVGSTGPLSLVGMDKWYHAIGYGVFGTVLAYALEGRRRALVLAVVGATGYGVVMELVQLPMALRDASVGDVVADAVGTALAVMVWWFVRRALRDEADLRA